MFDDDAARRALRTLTDEQAPPVVTTLEQVVRRGKRRLFVQRASAVAGVMAVVAAIGVGAILLRPGDQGDGTRVANPPTSASSTTVRLPGWTPVPIPPGGQRTVDGTACIQPFVQLPPEPDTPLITQQYVQDALVGAARSVVGPVEVTSSEWMADSPKHDAPRGYVDVEVPMDNGNGQLKLEAGRFGGTPEQVANASITVYGNCGEPVRRMLDDGTILQLYPLDDHDTKAPMQQLQIYRPDGLMYVITSAGWSASDLSPEGPEGSQVLLGGRGKLPVTEDQLADIGARFVTQLG